MYVVLSHTARLLEILQHIFYMTSISGDTAAPAAAAAATITDRLLHRGHRLSYHFASMV